MAEKYDTLRLHFNDFATRRDKRPQLSTITVHSASVRFTPSEEESIEQLFEEQFDSRIFSEEFIHSIEDEWLIVADSVAADSVAVQE